MFTVPAPRQEPVRDYAPGSAERASLEVELARVRKERVTAPLRIGGEWIETGTTFQVRAPHQRELVLADVHAADRGHVSQAIDVALATAHDWAGMPWHERAAVFLRAAELLAGPWRDRINAATMLGQSKSVYQSEIDAACELADFWRFNVAFAQAIYTQQPESAPGTWNRMDYRPLEGFVLAITPFNFTSIAANLPTAPALMGCVSLWKPSEKQALAAHHVMELLCAAGLPDGVVQLLHGDGATISDAAMAHPDFAGLHFTGSTAVLRRLWRTAGERIETYRSYPRIVGESGGKNFVLAHRSADPAALVVALGRGAFEYQGQKCSAASRAYLPRSLWPRLREEIADLARALPMGDIADLRVFMGAVIDAGAFERLTNAVAQARAHGMQVLVGGGAQDREGWFVEPSVLVTDDPGSDTMTRELFGPILTVFIYEDGEWDHVLDLIDQTSPYALTGSVFGQDRLAITQASDRLRHAAGNLYVNDKPTGAVVAQQPFGGARASGTNDKAGSPLNLLRWLSPRVIKETFVPPTDWRYSHMGSSARQ